MGEQDIENLHPIYRYAVDFCKLSNLPFSFKEDLGDFETAIQFKEEYFAHPPWSEDWESNPEIVVPDVLVLYQDTPVAVIEFEEETGNKRPGAKLAKKGHGHQGDYDTKRDTRRNEHYSTSNIPLLRIWESNFKKTTLWKISLTEFLISLWRKTLTDSLTIYSKIPNLDN